MNESLTIEARARLALIAVFRGAYSDAAFDELCLLLAELASELHIMRPDLYEAVMDLPEGANAEEGAMNMAKVVGILYELARD